MTDPAQVRMHLAKKICKIAEKGKKKSERLWKKSDKNYFEFNYPEQFHYIKHFLILKMKIIMYS